MLIKHKLVNVCNLNYSNNISKGGNAKNTKNNKIFKSSYKVYLIADATYKMAKYFNNRLDILKIDEKMKKTLNPHMTLMELIVNREHPDHKYIVDAYGQIPNTLKEILTAKYQQLSPQMYITSKKWDYEIMGEFIAKVYTASNSSYITEFRMALYKYLEIMLDKSSREVAILDGKKYFIYSYNGKKLIAIPEYYHGKGKWKPHMSIVKLSLINRNNPLLYLSYQQHGINAIIKPLLQAKGPIEQLNMSYHFNTLRISVIRV